MAKRTAEALMWRVVGGGVKAEGDVNVSFTVRQADLTLFGVASTC